MSEEHTSVIVAGGSGLVGSELIKQLLDVPSIKNVYALARRPLVFQSQKLKPLVSPKLQITDWQENTPPPSLGFICLGTTLKQAGSKQGLEKVDYDLVCQVAREMKVIGVKRLAVVSSLGASSRSMSHYLRCKGKMELALREMGFEQLTIARPGPLVGLRDSPRSSEWLTLVTLNVLKPLLIGPLQKIRPIRASHVAKSMLYSVYQPSSKRVTLLTTPEMKHMLSQYQHTND
ncbi:NAD(P)H-binding protein [Vibrio sp. AK197]